MEDTADRGLDVGQAIFFLARQQMLSTALLAARSVTSGASTMEEASASLMELAGAAETDCEGVEVMGREYGRNLRRYAEILLTGDLPRPTFTVIDGGLSADRSSDDTSG